MGLTTEPTINEAKRPPDWWPFAFPQSRLNPWRGLGGLPREIWLLFATNLVNRAGMMVLPFLVLYLTRARLLRRPSGFRLCHIRRDCNPRWPDLGKAERSHRCAPDHACVAHLVRY